MFDHQPIDGNFDGLVQIERGDLDVMDLFILEIQTGEPINQDHPFGHAASGPGSFSPPDVRRNPLQETSDWPFRCLP